MPWTRYPRTLEGFPILVEKDFASFGHPFQLRHAHGESRADRTDDQISPIFIQFLDAVWQLVNLFPASFEFTPRYLLQIAEHVTSCRFGTLLCNTDRERTEQDLRTRTVSLWSWLRLNRSSFLSLVYRRPNRLAMAADPRGGLLLPPVSVLLRGVVLWRDYFLRWSPRSSFTHGAAEARSHKGRGALGGIQYDEHDLDTSKCRAADLKLSEAACVNSEWDGWVVEATSEADKWRGKALQEKMQVMELGSDGLGGDGHRGAGTGSEDESESRSDDSGSESGEDHTTRASSALADLLQPLSPTGGACESAVAHTGPGSDSGAPCDAPQSEAHEAEQATVVLQLREEIRNLREENARQAEELAAARLRAQEVDPGDGGLLLALSKSKKPPPI